MNPKIIYTKGQVINKLVFLEEIIPSTKRRKSLFICHCGNLFIASMEHVKSRHTNSCGCSPNHLVKHGHCFITDKGKSTPEYSAWLKIKCRCYNKKNKRYADYGGRGIKVCDRWLESFENFIEDMGFRPSSKHSLDRFPDVNGNYEPSNCRWATSKEQNRNRRDNHLLTFNNETYCINEWAEKLGINQSLIHKRLKLRWTVEKALTTPVRKFNSK